MYTGIQLLISDISGLIGPIYKRGLINKHQQLPNKRSGNKYPQGVE